MEPSTVSVGVTHTISRPYVEGLAAGIVRFQRCRDCGTVQHLSKLACHTCGSAALDWQDAAGTATVKAVSTVWRAASADFRPLVPYVLVIAQLTEGPRLMAHGTVGLQVADAVKASFFQHGGRTLLRFLPT